ncbi:hypothetical protein [Thermoflavifilum thermophilum]|uniref:Uncharacterized protein n=1 Tax=Thermoflavifilum thermophilum TaxID=1393122 RepID=A0A1I7N9Y1_9BACT|nr:hypothetical protein [Thermoflavifilum thermophilum]SFV31482.1 hypothetical protein SAMN05660895_1087 [Thermoflavifilum thermophilum]
MLKLIDLAIDIFVIWLLYKFVTEFVIPVFQIGREVQRRIKSTQDTHTASHSEFYSSSRSSRHSARQPEGEYIDFEEIKDSPSTGK